jgi:hypothetical protein
MDLDLYLLSPLQFEVKAVPYILSLTTDVNPTLSEHVSDVL